MNLGVKMDQNPRRDQHLKLDQNPKMDQNPKKDQNHKMDQNPKMNQNPKMDENPKWMKIQSGRESKVDENLGVLICKIRQNLGALNPLHRSRPLYHLI